MAKKTKTVSTYIQNQTSPKITAVLDNSKSLSTDVESGLKLLAPGVKYHFLTEKQDIDISPFKTSFSDPFCACIFTVDTDL